MSQNHSPNQVLARKWRPRELSTLVGQEHVVRALRHALQTQRLHHAYLFTGTRGVGKTTLARILAKALNCETGITDTPCGRCSACVEIDQGRFVDLLEVDAATNTGVDEMRDLLENASYAPTAGRYKVYVIDEVHMLSKSAFNAMLKTLEEPPPHILFILATTDPQKIPVTVLSRCLQFNLKQMSPGHIVEHLQTVLAAENIAFEMGALQLIGRAAQGSMRDALSLTDQAIAYSAGSLQEASVQAMLGAVDQRHLYNLLEALAQHDGNRLLALADDMSERSLPLGAALQAFAVLIYRLSIAHIVPAAIAQDDPERETLMALLGLFSATELQLLYQIATHGRKEMIYAPDEATGFGMTLLRMLAFLPKMPESGLGARSEVSQPSRTPLDRKGSSERKSAPEVVTSGGGSVSSALPVGRAAVTEQTALPEPLAVVRSSPARTAMQALGNVLGSSGTGNATKVARQAVAPATAPGGEMRASPPRASEGNAVQAPVAASTSPIATPATKAAEFPVFEDSPPPQWEEEGDYYEQQLMPRLSLVKPVALPVSESVQTPSEEPPLLESVAQPAVLSQVSAEPSVFDGQWPNTESWPAFVRQMDITGLGKQALERTQWVGVSDKEGTKVVHLLVAVKAYLETSYVQRIQQALEKQLGAGLQVDLRLGEVTASAQLQQEQENRERQETAQAAIAADPFVNELQLRLGASIVPGSIRSI
jgi:DNA polymerase-3 subunit gamma/tau